MMAMCGGVLGASAADPYKVSVKLTDDEEGAMVFLTDFDKSSKIDSALVVDKEVVFTGEIDEPVLAQLVIDMRGAGTFVLESGSIVVDKTKRKAFGSMLNDQLNEYFEKVKALSDRLQTAGNDSIQNAIFEEYVDLNKSSLAENADNPLGLYYFMQLNSYLSPDEFFGLLDKYPSLKSFNYVNKVFGIQSNRAATKPGTMFRDFEVTYEGKESRLSDYVGKGKYVLVDYWASWCVPCIRQIPVLKELLAEFGDKGLEVLGVAVWNKPEDTLKAIESHGITWPCIINAQHIPTDIYGISGIPCIILYGPDGKILSRDKQGDELKADVRAAFAGTLKVD